MRLRLPGECGHRQTTDWIMRQAKRPPIFAALRLQRLRYITSVLEAGPTVPFRVAGRYLAKP
eukprot:208763-Pyramimonas_sp.AAC.1